MISVSIEQLGNATALIKNEGEIMTGIRFAKVVCVAAVFCLATALISAAQSADRIARWKASNTMSPLPDFTPSGLSFAPAVTYNSGSYGAEGVAVADVNGDGIPDVIVAGCAEIPNEFCGTEEGTVGVLLGNGDGTFQPAVTYLTGVAGGPQEIAVADLNGDGHPDVLVLNQAGSSNADGTVSVLINNGNGTFQTGVNYDTGGYEATAFVVADVNGDGIPDVMVTNVYRPHEKGGYNVAVLLGNGDGTFQTPVDYRLLGDNLGGSLAVADVNGDGNPDLLVGVDLNNDSQTGAVELLLGNGDGTFQAPVSYSAGENSGAVVVADLNGDGKPDLVVSNFCTDSTCNSGGVSVLLGNGNGTFQAPVTYPSGGFYPIPVAVADVNSDGIPDVIVGNCGNDSKGSQECYTTNAYVGVLLGNGDGTLQPAVDFATGGDLGTGLAAADLTGDGKPDIVVSNCLPTGGGTCGKSSDGVVGVLINTNTVSRTATKTVLASSLNASIEGQAVTFTATVSSSGGKPTGTVNFFYGSTNLGDAVLNSSGLAAFSISTLPVGTDSMTAVYNGNVTLAPSTTSPALQQVVKQATTTTTLISSPNPSTVGQTVTFTATIAGEYAGTPWGTVTFKDGNTVLVRVRTKDKVATFSTSTLTQGSHTIQAIYSGNKNFKGSSGSVVQVVN
jgi:hypothetical protein